MLTGKRKLFASVFLSIFVAFYVGAQSDAMTRLANKYLTEAEDAHEKAQFEDAYKKVNAAITMYQNYGTVPEHIFVIAKPIYKDYLTRIKNTKDWDKVQQVNTMIQSHPELQTIQIVTLQKQIEETIEADKEAAKDERQAQREKERDEKAAQRERENNEKNRAMMQKMSEQQQEGQKALVSSLTETITDSLAESNEKLTTTFAEGISGLGSDLSAAAEAQKESSHTLMIVILCLAGVVVVVFVIVLIGHVASSRAQRQQQGQFEATLKLVAGMQQQSNQLLLGAAPDLYGQGMRSAGSSRWGVDALPAPELDDGEKEALKNLAVTCEELGTKIDKASGRKNNSKNVSELVYKLAMHFGMNQNTAMAYFCAAMVYDAGYLSLDQELLAAENFTPEQREQMRTHVEEKMFKPYFINVPEMFHQIFWDAASSHHENMDGSGYPKGLLGEDIPQIARLIHVVESYTSLISRRNYKAIMDRDSAINDLMSKPEIYDSDVVAALDEIL